MKRIHTKTIFVISIVLILLFGTCGISFYQASRMEFTSTTNQVRLEVNPHVQEVKDGIYEPFQYPYIVARIDGMVEYNDSKVDAILGQKINLQELIQLDESFQKIYPETKKEVFLLESDGQVTEFLVYFIPEREYSISQMKKEWIVSFWPCVLGILISSFLMVGLIHFQKRRILRPISEISSSAKAIIQGNYDLEVVRTYEETVRENEMGDLIYSFELMRDELKEKQLREEQLKQSQQELISCISHDLRTPISTIKAYVEGIRDGIANTEQKQKMFIEIILQKVNLLSKMIQELLECSNAELNQLSIQKEERYLQGFWKPLMKELKIYCKQQEITLEYEMMNEDVIIVIDAKRITELMYNLIENSIKYRSEQPLKIQVNLQRVGDELLIQVIDNGIGIHTDDVGRVFDKFYRADQSRTSNIPGSGLGLSICKYIVEQHAGRIYCKSQIGCEVGFTLPIS